MASDAKPVYRKQLRGLRASVRNLMKRKAALRKLIESSYAASTSWCCSWCWRCRPSVTMPTPPPIRRRVCWPGRISGAAASRSFFGGIRRYFLLGGENRVLLDRITQGEGAPRALRGGGGRGPAGQLPAEPRRVEILLQGGSVASIRSTGSRISSRSTGGATPASSPTCPYSRPTARWWATWSTARTATPWRCRCSTPHSGPAASSPTRTTWARSIGTGSTRMW